MSNKYEDLIKKARVNAECGEHMSPAEVTTLLNVVETTFAALAAENAGLKKFCKDAAFDADYEAELGMERGGFTDALNDIKTPATDAFLSEVRAQGVDVAIEHLITKFEGTGRIGVPVMALEWLAKELRIGVQS